MPIKWKINDGQILDVSAKAKGDTVFMTYRGSDYERNTTYYNVGQKLVEETTIKSQRIATPIHYKLIYK